MTPYHFNNMGLLLLTFTLLWFYFTFAEHLTAVYGGDSFELAVFWSKIDRKICPPLLDDDRSLFLHSLSHPGLETDHPGLLIASISIVIGMWLERFLIIIPSFSQPRLPYARGLTSPSWVEWSMMAGLFAGFTLAFVLFSKFFPCDLDLGDGKGSQREKGKEHKSKYRRSLRMKKLLLILACSFTFPLLFAGRGPRQSCNPSEEDP